MPSYYNTGSYNVWGLESLTNGTALTGAVGHLGNSGCEWIATATGGSVTASTAAASAGTMGYKFTTVAAGISDGRFSAAASNLTHSSRWDGFYFSVLPGTEMRVAELKDSAEATAAYIVITPAGDLKIYDAGDLNGTNLTTALTAGTKYDIAFELVAATSTTGHYTVVVYTPETSTALFSPTPVTTYNLGSTALLGWDFGIVNAQANMTVGVGNIQMHTGTGALMPPLLPPTAAFTATPTGLTEAFDGTSSTVGVTGGAGITAYAWAFGDATTGSGSTVSHNYASAGAKTVVLTVTDALGLKGIQSTPITVPGVSPTGLVLSVDSAGGFTAVNAPDLVTAVTDNSQTSWDISVTTPTAVTNELKLRLNPLAPPAASTNLLITVYADVVVATSGTLLLKMYQGATTISSQAAQSLTVVADGSTQIHQLTFTVPSTDWAAVTDWTALDLGFGPVAA